MGELVVCVRTVHFISIDASLQSSAGGSFDSRLIWMEVGVTRKLSSLFFGEIRQGN